MDRSIWATWYDLPKEDEAEYNDWLHHTHIRETLKRPGYMWAAHYELVDRESPKSKKKDHLAYTDDPSIPNGTEFLLLFGAASAEVFLSPNPAQLAETYSDETKAMIAKRIGERTGIFTEVDRVNGPAADTRAVGGVPAPIVQMGAFNCFTPEDDFDLSSWYAQDRLPAMKYMRGCVGTRKLVSVAGWAKHSIFYEFASLEKVLAHFPRADKLFPGENDWSYHVCQRLLHAPGSPTRGKRIWPPVE